MKIHTAPTGQPIGPPVRTAAAQNAIPTTLKGRYVNLVPLAPEHAQDLSSMAVGPANDHIWTYMATGPYRDFETFQKDVSNYSTSSTTSFFAIQPAPGLAAHFLNLEDSAEGSSAKLPSVVGMISYLNIVPAIRSIEIGHVTYTSVLQRTVLATEVLYLLMRHAFEDLGYSRVEWKCNSLNAPSRRAAERLGFEYEGLFRRHSVAKGHRRDTWWASIVEDEWWGGENGVDADGKEIDWRTVAEAQQTVASGEIGSSFKVREQQTSRKWALEQWLNQDNYDESGKQKKKLESFQQWKEIK